MRVLPLALRRDPLDVLASLAREPGAFAMDVPDPERPVVLLGCAPRAVLSIDVAGRPSRSDGGVVPADPLVAIERFVAEAADGAALPFPFGATVVGYLGYELGRLVEPPRDDVRGHAAPALPLARLARYDALLAYDRSRGQYGLVCRDDAGHAPAWLERVTEPSPPWEGAVATAPLAPLWPRERYLAAVRRVLAYLAAGDAYQVNLTQPFAAPLAAPAW